MNTYNTHIVPFTGEALTTGVTVPRYAYQFEFKGLDFEGILRKEILATSADGKKLPATEDLDPYMPDETLKETIDLMQMLERPLLLRGEPGCGKTRVAQAYAYERYKAEPEGYRRYYYEWHVKSTSRAQDGLYSFDHVARLRENNGEGGFSKEGPVKYRKEDLIKYRELGPLGKAFLASEPGKPAILLIDEIDKADIDFPNDLLLELDEMRFVVRETGEEIIPRSRPLIFITSNQERELPQAFLRRCLFHYIQFPDKKLLETIMLANFPVFREKQAEKGMEYITNVINRFSDLRMELQNNPTVNKNVSTSELKDWIRILSRYFEKDPQDARIDVSDKKLPFHTALLKTENDLKSIGKFGVNK